MKKRIIGFAGSLRKESLNKAVIQYMAEEEYEYLTIDYISLENIPMFNGDVEEAGEPEAVSHFKSQLKKADGILIAAPEYSQSMPGVLKNALDWAGSMTYENVLENKPVLIVGASPTQMGTGFSQAHLRQVLAACNALPLQQPQVYINQAPKKIINGKITDEKTKAALNKALSAFSEWLNKLA
ncbi:NADPH-dependent FMN reductase [Alkalicoccus daliensis]|uniref:NAD(P)H-dependent FMN reductase n=1 Tax=Alkalicoccus daliensis TaxID=745820 RepID=A0A1G9ZHS6_9BACI|nr:NAD(P)H-dependent oxidoreductase [Alkalicoccus daliensis]SDN20561.1 NAD(P)H-dependent FMN reductase [Alkalicoccus daliensis]